MAHPVQIALILASFTLCLGPALGQDVGAGETIARMSCSSCHEIGSRRASSFGLAPSFVKIANTRGMTQTSIEVFLSTPHEVMPNYSLSWKEIRDVAAYIVSLRKPSHVPKIEQ
jgi:mono/diheme cytochrome c family protein